MESRDYYLELEPVAKGRPRVTRKGTTYTPEKTRRFESNVALMARYQTKGGPLKGALSVEINFYVTRPKSAKNRKYPSVRPDLDNYCKAVLDGMEGIAFGNDSQIIELKTTKEYSLGK